MRRLVILIEETFRNNCVVFFLTKVCTDLILPEIELRFYVTCFGYISE